MNSFFARRPPAETSSGKAGVNSAENTPWVEKYRPRRVDDVVFQSEAVSVLQKVIDGADLPNILFYGPPGTGKTSAAVALCRQLFKTTEAYKDRVLEMNASDERGIAIVRTRIKDFAHRAVGTSASGSTPAVKVIILDEADAMTDAAQAALRRTMEKYSKSTRFFLICNYISRIIDPLTSRCAKFRFKPLPEDLQLGRLKSICEAEGVKADEEALSTLIQQTGGDLRKSITTLQALSCASKRLEMKDVKGMGGRIPDDQVSSLLATLRSRPQNELAGYLKTFRREGHGVGQLLIQLHDALLDENQLDQLQKAAIFEKMATCEYRLAGGGSEELQLLSLAYSLHNLFTLCTSN